VTDAAANVRRLREHARDFARAYVSVLEAMLAEGVPEATARSEARDVAFLAVMTGVTMEPWEK